ncbi:hypothetical protein D9Y22_16520 [Methylorubrum sp. DB1722]|nr:hypothetical protein [Methylorubrum sp. DB1722]
MGSRGWLNSGARAGEHGGDVVRCRTGCPASMSEDGAVEAADRAVGAGYRAAASRRRPRIDVRA